MSDPMRVGLPRVSSSPGRPHSASAGRGGGGRPRCPPAAPQQATRDLARRRAGRTVPARNRGSAADRRALRRNAGGGAFCKGAALSLPTVERLSDAVVGMADFAVGPGAVAESQVQAGAQTYDRDGSLYGQRSRFMIVSPASLREELMALVADALREEPGDDGLA